MVTEDDRWLDDTEQEAWLALVGVLLRLNPALDSQVQRDSKMTHFDYQVLAKLSDVEPHVRSMSDLALAVNSSLSRLSHVVKKLEARGWVARTPSPLSRRVTDCALTEEGYAVLVAAAPGHVRAVRHLVFDGLSREQVEQLSAIAGRIQANLDATDLRTVQ